MSQRRGLKLSPGSELLRELDKLLYSRSPLKRDDDTCLVRRVYYMFRAMFTSSLTHHRKADLTVFSLNMGRL